jgi:hypothetical protein
MMAVGTTDSRLTVAARRAHPAPVLNWIWAAFFVIAFVAAGMQVATGARPDALKDVVAALFDSSKTGFEIALGLTGVMSLWLGFMRIAEKGGITEYIAWLVGPLFQRLFPGIPKGHPASGAIVMNRSAKHARARQRRHAAGAQGDEGAAVAQPGARPRLQRHGAVRGHERVVGDARTHLDHDVPRAVGCRQPGRCVRAHS